MASQKTLTDWILSRRSELDVRVKDCTWIRDVFPNWYDLDLTIAVGGSCFTGRGAAHDSDTALAKAFCEAVERSICHSRNISSLGVAGHFDQAKAKENAKLEFIERKALFDQVTDQVELTPLGVDQSLQRRYTNHGIALNLYELQSSESNVVLSIADGGSCATKFGGILGLGAHSDLEAAKRKALIECLRNVEAFLNSPTTALTFEEFKTISNPTGRERQALLQDRAYFTSLMDSFRLKSDKRPLEICGEHEHLELAGGVFGDCPLQFFRFTPFEPKPIELDFVG